MAGLLSGVELLGAPGPAAQAASLTFQNTLHHDDGGQKEPGRAELFPSAFPSCALPPGRTTPWIGGRPRGPSRMLHHQAGTEPLAAPATAAVRDRPPAASSSPAKPGKPGPEPSSTPVARHPPPTPGPGAQSGEGARARPEPGSARPRRPVGARLGPLPPAAARPRRPVGARPRLLLRRLLTNLRSASGSRSRRGWRSQTPPAGCLPGSGRDRGRDRVPPPAGRAPEPGRRRSWRPEPAGQRRGREGRLARGPAGCRKEPEARQPPRNPSVSFQAQAERSQRGG